MRKQNQLLDLSPKNVGLLTNLARNAQLDYFSITKSVLYANLKPLESFHIIVFFLTFFFNFFLRIVDFHFLVISDTVNEVKYNLTVPAVPQSYFFLIEIISVL